MIHEGERVVPKAFNRANGGNAGSLVQNFHFAAPTDTRSQAQVGAAAYQGAQRHYQRNR